MGCQDHKFCKLRPQSVFTETFDAANIVKYLHILFPLIFVVVYNICRFGNYIGRLCGKFRQEHIGGSEMGKRRRQFHIWIVEFPSESKMGDARRKLNRFVKVIPEGKVRD